MSNSKEKKEPKNEVFKPGDLDEILANIPKEITDKIEKRKQVKEKSQKKKKNLIIFNTILLIIIAGFFVYGAYRQSHLKKYEIVEKLEDFPDPIQEPVEKEPIVLKKVLGKDITIEFLDSYSIMGRVLYTRYYFPYTAINKISPKDIGLGWGPFTSKESINAWTFTYNQFLDRTMIAKSDDDKWTENNGGTEYLNTKYSHNHLIYSNDHIKELFGKIKKNDYIKIEGYLVSASHKGLTEDWKSSETRDDESCEIIYVTDIKWLKTKK